MISQRECPRCHVAIRHGTRTAHLRHCPVPVYQAGRPIILDELRGRANTPAAVRAAVSRAKQARYRAINEGRA